MMNTINMPGEVETAFDHLAAYGLMAILEADSPGLVRVRWTDELTPRLELTGTDWATAAAAVRDHATHHTSPESWIQLNGSGTSAGLFSPRVATMDDARLDEWYAERRRALDAIRGRWAALDIAMIGALGEPSYWSNERDGPRPDHGANRWEMKTRNNGQDFVAHRLRKFASHVAARSLEQVTNALRGVDVIDEDGRGRLDSRTPTGLMPLGPADTVRAWCALWGISLLPVVHRGTPALPSYYRDIAVSKSTGHLGNHKQGYLFLPVMTEAWPLARLARVLTSRHLAAVAMSGLSAALGGLSTEIDTIYPWHWLRGKGVAAVVRFPVYRSPNEKAPEKWAQRGRLLFSPVVEVE